MHIYCEFITKNTIFKRHAHKTAKILHRSQHQRTGLEKQKVRIRKNTYKISEIIIQTRDSLFFRVKRYDIFLIPPVILSSFRRLPGPSDAKSVRYDSSQSYGKVRVEAHNRSNDPAKA